MILRNKCDLADWWRQLYPAWYSAEATGDAAAAARAQRASEIEHLFQAWSCLRVPRTSIVLGSSKEARLVAGIRVLRRQVGKLEGEDRTARLLALVRDHTGVWDVVASLCGAGWHAAETDAERAEIVSASHFTKLLRVALSNTNRSWSRLFVFNPWDCLANVDSQLVAASDCLIAAVQRILTLVPQLGRDDKRPR